MIIELVAGCEEPQRIDKYLGEVLPEHSRAFFQKLIKENQVCVNGKIIKNNYKTLLGDAICIDLPEPRPCEIIPEEIPLEILYEDNDVILVNKRKGMVVHPAAGHDSGTLVHALLFHCKDNLSGINGILRPGIVHRIDRDTTGVLIVCKNDYAHNHIAKQLKEHSITRKYVAIVQGLLKEQKGTVDAPIGRHPKDRKKMSINEKNGKHAITHYRVLQYFSKTTLIECELETGRTHQIRVHMASLGHVLLGDTVYGANSSKYQLEGQTLHAKILGFVHPTTNEYMEFEAPIPEYFDELCKKL